MSETDVFQQMSYNLGNAMRELWQFQHGEKNVESLRRASNYIANEIGRSQAIALEAKPTEPGTGKFLVSKGSK